MDDCTRRLVRLFTAAVGGDWATVAQVRRAAPTGEPNRAWREAVLQVHLFAGFPRMLQTFETLVNAGGLGELDDGEATLESDQRDRGRLLFNTIYGKHHEAVQGQLQTWHPDAEHFVMGHAYGRVLTRDGLSAAQRELLAVGGLAMTDQDRQLAGHARGAIRCGATAEDVLEVLDLVKDLLTEPRYDRVRTVAQRFAS